MSLNRSWLKKAGLLITGHRRWPTALIWVCSLTRVWVGKKHTFIFLQYFGSYIFISLFSFYAGKVLLCMYLKINCSIFDIDNYSNRHVIWACTMTLQVKLWFFFWLRVQVLHPHTIRSNDKSSNKVVGKYATNYKLFSSTYT